jgi:hypothetical protein
VSAQHAITHLCQEIFLHGSPLLVAIIHWRGIPLICRLLPVLRPLHLAGFGTYQAMHWSAKLSHKPET